jgi:hypothetical protein
LEGPGPSNKRSGNDKGSTVGHWVRSIKKFCIAISKSIMGYFSRLKEFASDIAKVILSLRV